MCGVQVAGLSVLGREKPDQYNGSVFHAITCMHACTQHEKCPFLRVYKLGHSAVYKQLPSREWTQHMKFVLSPFPGLETAYPLLSAQACTLLEMYILDVYRPYIWSTSAVINLAYTVMNNNSIDLAKEMAWKA